MWKHQSGCLNSILNCVVCLRPKSERESLQKRIVQFYLNFAKRQKNLTVNHFLNDKIPRRTIYNVITKYEECDHIGDKQDPVVQKNSARNILAD